VVRVAHVAACDCGWRVRAHDRLLLLPGVLFVGDCWLSRKERLQGLWEAGDDAVALVPSEVEGDEVVPLVGGVEEVHARHLAGVGHDDGACDRREGYLEAHRAPEVRVVYLKVLAAAESEAALIEDKVAPV